MKIKFALVLFSSLTSISYAFDFSNRVESEHFTVYYQNGVDPLDIAYKINIGNPLYLYKDESKVIVRGNEPKQLMVQNIDILFKEVCNILDMHLYSYHGDIKIYQSKEELKKTFSEMFGGELKSESFYCYEENTIYISTQGINPGILGHEMAHAIINHYFVVMPPMKVQEVLAGYVEYSINKKLRKK